MEPQGQWAVGSGQREPTSTSSNPSPYTGTLPGDGIKVAARLVVPWHQWPRLTQAPAHSHLFSGVGTVFTRMALPFLLPSDMQGRCVGEEHAVPSQRQSVMLCMHMLVANYVTA